MFFSNATFVRKKQPGLRIASGFALVLASIICRQHATAQAPLQYSVKQYTSDNGLLQNSVHSIAFDKNGYCWLATEMGLVRFDGQNFVHFNKRNLPGLNSNFFICLPKDSAQNIYSTETFGTSVKIIAGKNKGSHVITVPEKILRNKIGPSYTGQLPVEVLRPYCDSLTLHRMNRRRHYAVLNQTALYAFYENKLWYITDKQVQPMLLPNTIKSITEVTLVDSTFIHAAPGNKITALRNGILLPKLNRIYGDIVNDEWYAKGQYSLHWSDAGTFIFCGKNLYTLRIENNSLVTHLLFQQLAVSDVTCVQYNALQQLYYIGTLSGGMYIIKPAAFTVITQPDKGIANNSYFSQTLLPDGCIAANNYKFYLDGSKTPFVLNTRRMSDLLYENNRLWIVIEDSVKCFSYPDMQLLYLNRLPGIVNEIYYAADDSALYLCTPYNLMVIKNFHVQSLLSKPDIFKDGNSLTSLYLIDDDNFYLGAVDGLYKYNIRSGKITPLHLKSMIEKFYTGSGNHLWVSTYGNGFGLLRNDKLFVFPVDDQQKLNVVYSIFEDKSGYMWLTTNSGLFRAPVSDLLNFANGKSTHIRYELFNTSDGLLTNEFNGGYASSVIGMPDGRLSLVSSNGLVWFNPDKISTRDYLNNIFIDGVYMNDRELAGAEAAELKVEAGFYKLVFHVSSPYFGNSYDNNIHYRIPEISPEWLEAPVNGEIIFNRLPRGLYTLELNKINGSSQAAKMIRFRVMPHFYETRGFVLLCIFALLTMLWLLYRWRLSLLSEQKKKLEKKVYQRTEELNSNMLHLEKTIKELELSEERIFRNGVFKEKVTSMILHDLRSPLRFLSGVANHIRQHYNRMPEPELDRQLNELATACSNVYYFSNDFMEWIKAQQNDFTINVEVIKVQQVFEEIAQLYYTLSKHKHNSIVIEHTAATCCTDLNILRIIIRNLVDNANKYTHSGKITMRAVQQQRQLHITVSDEGKGISPELIEVLQKGIAIESNTPSQTLGLKLVLDLTRLINGAIDFSSELQKGTSITIRLNN
jgi:signal transduction histidine kinase